MAFADMLNFMENSWRELEKFVKISWAYMALIQKVYITLN